MPANNNKTLRTHMYFNVIIVLLLLAMFSSFPVTANADTGPKPKVTVTIDAPKELLASGNLYITLLSKSKYSGPHRYDDDTPYSTEKDQQIDDAFAAYADKDGFYYLHLCRQLTEDATFTWGYYPPSPFKIAVYNVQTQKIYCYEEILERYAFSSYYKLSFDGENFTSKIIKNYDYFGEICKLILRIALTFAVEVGIAFLFGYRKTQITIIIIVNLITQIALNVALNAINYNSGSFAMLLTYILAEICIVFAEMLCYCTIIPIVDKRKGIKSKIFFIPVIYAIIANVASFGIGALYFTIIGI